jgi:hypothetical protein
VRNKKLLPIAPKRQQALSSSIKGEVVNLKDRSFEAWYLAGKFEQIKNRKLLILEHEKVKV